MGSERRNCARRILYSPEYLDMGVDNGGVVVDLSEGGLRFQAVGRVEANADVPLSFSLGTGYRIDVEARIVWVSPRGNSGGVAFKKLSSDSRSLIREWLAKPEEEHRAESVAATPEAEPEVESEAGDIQQAPVASANAASTASVSAPVATARPSAGEVFEDRSQGARIEEIFAPGPIFTEDLPQTAQQIASHAVANAASAAPQARPLPIPNVPVRVTTRHFAPQSIHPAAPSQTPPERKPASGATNASFSVVPSISQWASRGSAAPRIPARTNPLQSGEPLFPLRGSENIFARNRWEPPEIEESHSGRKLLMIVLLLVVLGAVFLGVAYENGYREQIGAAIERVGSTVARGPDSSTSSAPTPASNTPADSPSNASPSSATPKNSSPSAAPQSVSPSVAPSQTAPTPGTAPSTSTAANSSPASTNAAPQNHPQANPPETSANGQSTRAPSQSAGQTSTLPANAAQPSNQDAALKQGQNPRQSPSLSAPTSADLAESAAQSEFLRAQQYLTGSGVPQDPATAAEWFWRSLEAGNTAAAVPLADLYIAGKGVSRSCQQARILLDTAARKGNADAVHKLAELPTKCD